MGILNVTPNSFYDGGKHREINSIIHQVDKMLSEGADFIDIGAYSSKPSAEFVSETDEINRLVYVIKELVNTIPNIILSVDTFRAEVAKVAVDSGVAAPSTTLPAPHTEDRYMPDHPFPPAQCQGKNHCSYPARQTQRLRHATRDRDRKQTG